MLKRNTLKKPKRTLKMKNPKASSTLKKRPINSKSTKRMAKKADKKTLRRPFPNGKKQSKPSVSFMSDKKLTLEDKSEAPQGSKAFQSSGSDSKNSESKTIFMPIKQEPNGQTAEAIIVEDKEKASVQNVEIVEEAEK